jgi:uncharacterized coiled-coil protein SlyX
MSNAFDNLSEISKQIHEQQVLLGKLEKKLAISITILENIECGEQTRFELDQVIEKLQKIQVELY